MPLNSIIRNRRHHIIWTDKEDKYPTASNQSKPEIGQNQFAHFTCDANYTRCAAIFRWEWFLLSCCRQQHTFVGYICLQFGVSIAFVWHNHAHIARLYKYTHISVARQYINIIHESETPETNRKRKKYTPPTTNKRRKWWERKKFVRERQEKINIENENWKHLWIL